MNNSFRRKLSLNTANISVRRVEFWITKAHQGFLCLITLSVSLAIEAKTFKAYDTAGHLMTQRAPPHSKMQYIEVDWKKEMLDKDILSLAYVYALLQA